MYLALTINVEIYRSILVPSANATNKGNARSRRENRSDLKFWNLMGRPFESTDR